VGAEVLIWWRFGAIPARGGDDVDVVGDFACGVIRSDDGGGRSDEGGNRGGSEGSWRR
jgi:hypothetical protein